MSESQPRPKHSRPHSAPLPLSPLTPPSSSTLRGERPKPGFYSEATAMYVLDRVGVALAAASAALVVGRGVLDIVSGLCVGYVSALAGITMRDFLIGRSPITWVRDTSYQYATMVTFIATLIIVRNLPPIPYSYTVVADALAMVAIAMVTTREAEKAHVPSFAIGFLAGFTGIVGGLARDLSCQEVPLAMKSHIYATSLVAGACVYLLMQGRGVRQPVSFWVAFAVALLFRFAAVFGGWELPFFNPPHAPFGPTAH
ncbi:hypothetical protein DB346_13060 [Verrucomicrobia bacterium LW23]|nr:hypothetical protein DB346_13060 [Verrucomicrobia bacterium LW23]